MTTLRPAILATAIGLAASPAVAFHRTTPPAVAITTSGDSALPRVPALGNRLALEMGANILRFDRHVGLLETLTTEGTNVNPAISTGGSVVAWEADCDQIQCDGSGRQIFMRSGNAVFQVTFDPTGTSGNPVLSGRGNRLAFESEGDLAGSNGAGARQVFRWIKSGEIEQISRGAGMSGNAALSKSGRIVVFDSTSELISGDDTGISQIWLSTTTGAKTVLTSGAGPSRRPAIAANGRLVAFESRADLAGDGADTGTWQIFAYDLSTETHYQLTADPGGCTSVSVDDISADFRLGYSCGGVGYLHNVRANDRFRLPLDGGDTAQAVVELGVHFVVVSTTANPIAGGTTAGHQVYLLNLFATPPVAVPSDGFPY